MIRSWVLVMVIVSTSVAAHLCGAPETSVSLGRGTEGAADGGTSAVERASRGPVREAMLSRDERIQAHRQKIENIIEENQAKRAQERIVAPGVVPSPLERVDGFVEEGTEHYVVKLASGLGKADAEKLKRQVSEDVPHGHVQLESLPSGPEGERYQVTLGRLASRDLASAMYRALQQSGYRFDTLPGWGSSVEKRDGVKGNGMKRSMASNVVVNTPPVGPPMRRTASAGGGRRDLPDFVTSGTFGGAGQASPTLAEYLSGQTSETVEVHLAFSGAPVERVLDSIERQSGIRVAARGKVGGEAVSIVVRNGSVAEVLSQILGQRGDWLLYAPSGREGALELWDGASFQGQVLPKMTERRVFDIREISLPDAQSAVLLLLTPGVGRAVPVGSNNKLIVTDLPKVLGDVEELLGQIDRKAMGMAAPPGVESRY